jgi:hypothetical protein
MMKLPFRQHCSSHKMMTSSSSFLIDCCCCCFKIVKNYHGDSSIFCLCILQCLKCYNAHTRSWLISLFPLTLKAIHSHPSQAIGNWFQELLWISKSTVAEVPYKKRHNVCCNLHTSSSTLIIISRLLTISNIV